MPTLPDATLEAAGNSEANEEQPTASPSPGSEYRQEVEVRLTAQQILSKHSRKLQQSEPREGDDYWEGLSINLRGAYLINFNLSDCKLESLNVDDSTLAGESIFCGLEVGLLFVQGAIFEPRRGRAYSRSDFRGLTVRHDAYFSDSSFQGVAQFGGDQHFPPAKFERAAAFRNCHFQKRVDFTGVQFANPPDFADAKTLARGSSWPDGWRASFDDAAGTGFLVRAH
jgi:uncharacterized protein YjbI with pentapeptide repeats